MTEVFSPRNYRSHDDKGDGDAQGMDFSPRQSISVNIDSLEELFESPLSPFTIDSSPLVSPLSLSSDTQEVLYRSTSRRGAPARRMRRPSSVLSESEPVELPVIALLLAAFKRTGLTCKAGVNDIAKMDIGWPTNVRHIAHVTFDRFNGFLGLPVEFELEVPRRVPSASVSVFGVSAESMQCSYDRRGNSVPTILLLLQERLYDQGGLQAEGIFRINAENSQEEHLRDELNKGIVPYDIDVHCLAGLIKAWFRELPKGVLDSLTPEQVMQCHTEDQCLALVGMLPPTQAALLNWAINLMADVVQEEGYNKMNARNIAMVFAPNMTQMSDPLTALMHAVQVMNLLKTLIVQTIKDREEAVLNPRPASSCNEPKDGPGYDNADLQPGVTIGALSGGTQNEYDIEEEECFLKAFKESETFEEYESACGSEEMFPRCSSTNDITDEDEISFESQGPFSNGSSTLDNTDDDSMGLQFSSHRKIVHSGATTNVFRPCISKDDDMASSSADVSPHFNKAQYVPVSADGKQKYKIHKKDTETKGSDSDTKGFVQCGVLESPPSKKKAKSGQVAAKIDQQNERVEVW